MTHAVAAATIVIIVSMSFFTAYIIGDIPRIPMHWNTNWTPTMYAPKWIGLSIIPVIGIFVMASIFVSIRNKTEKQQIRDVAVVGLILLASHIFHIYLIKQWFATISI